MLIASSSEKPVRSTNSFVRIHDVQPGIRYNSSVAATNDCPSSFASLSTTIGSNPFVFKRIIRFRSFHFPNASMKPRPRLRRPRAASRRPGGACAHRRVRPKANPNPFMKRIVSNRLLRLNGRQVVRTLDPHKRLARSRPRYGEEESRGAHLQSQLKDTSGVRGIGSHSSIRLHRGGRRCRRRLAAPDRGRLGPMSMVAAASRSTFAVSKRRDLG